MTMPEEIWVSKTDDELRAGYFEGVKGMFHTQYILKSTVDAQMHRTMDLWEADIADHKKATAADDKTIAALAVALETLYADFKIHAGYVYSERTEQTLSDNAPRIAEANHIANAGKMVAEEGE